VVRWLAKDLTVKHHRRIGAKNLCIGKAARNRKRFLTRQPLNVITGHFCNSWGFVNIRRLYRKSDTDLLKKF
jgi:hypothetical protein